MSLQTRLTALAQAIGADIKALFAGKQDTLASGTNIKTINGESLLGSGDLAVAGGGGGLATPAGNDKEVQYNNSGAAAGAANVEIDNGDLALCANAAPVTPPSGNVKLFGKTLASRVMLASVGPSGFDAALQPAIWRQKIAWWSAQGNTAAANVFSMATLTSVGASTVARTVATTNLLTRTRRVGYIGSVGNGQVGGHYSPALMWSAGDGGGLGGFFYSCRFAFTDAAAVSGAIAFVGMRGTTAPPSATASAANVANSVGIAQFQDDATQLYAICKGTGAPVVVPLGTNFPPMAAAGASNGIMYDLTLFAPPSENGVIYYQFERIGTAFVASGSFAAAPISSSTLLTHSAYRSNNATALAVGIDISSVYIETDY